MIQGLLVPLQSVNIIVTCDVHFIRDTSFRYFVCQVPFLGVRRTHVTSNDNKQIRVEVLHTIHNTQMYVCYLYDTLPFLKVPFLEKHTYYLQQKQKNLIIL